MHKEYVDAMLMRKIVSLREQMQKGNLNPLWVERMLQVISDDNHAGDFSFRPILATLKRPHLSEVCVFLERIAKDGKQRGWHPHLDPLIKTMNWNDGPDEVDVTVATMRNMFQPSGHGEVEGEVILLAKEQRLQTCPDWVVPALALHAEAEGPTDVLKGLSLNLCLTSDPKTSTGFGMFFRKHWYYYLRDANPKTSWTPGMNWLMVKPRS
jgi:hypothetical protein